ncbi:Copper transport protein 86 [Spathaspora sp. JA1]|nr:Copper transport protein 86 [Spathaspora sp. JA1]
MEIIIQDSLKDLQHNDFTNLANRLSSISQLLNSELALPKTTQISQILQCCPNNTSIESIRLYRGLLLIIRNLAPKLTQDDLFIQAITSYIQFNKLDIVESDWKTKTEVVYWQILANFPRNEIVTQVNDLFNQIQYDDMFRAPIIHFLFRQFFTEDIEVTNFKLQQVFKEGNYILEYIHKLYQTIDFNNPDHDCKMLIHLIYDVITHESFITWIVHSEGLFKWLELTDTVIQTRDQWNIYELTALISWNMEVFLAQSKDLTSILQDFDLEQILSVNLNILSELSKFEILKKLLVQYPNFLPQLISTFHKIHNSIKPITLKSNDKIESVTSYSGVKSSIIIILSHLCHESTDIQDQIRELGGLALVLSNCIIDNNNPFIKEHAIICLKYLLLDNPRNQQVVADLEAKQTVDDQVLQEVGYQVDIVDGEVKLKKK